MRARVQGPLPTALAIPLGVHLDGEDARQAREIHQQTKRLTEPKPARDVPDPTDRVLAALAACEGEDPGNFGRLSLELSLDGEREHYTLCRFLTETPRWTAASPEVHSRIVEAAKRFLVAPTDEPELVRIVPINRILPGYMAAIWLLAETSSDWLDTLPDSWWKRWAWYVMRELHPGLADEPEEPKIAVLRRLLRRVPQAVRDHIVELAGSAEAESLYLFSELLGRLVPIPDGALDRQLFDALLAGRVAEDRVGISAEFLLGRDASEDTIRVLTSLLSAPGGTLSDRSLAALAVTLLASGQGREMDAAMDFVDRRAELGAECLGAFAYAERRRLRRRTDEDDGNGPLDFRKVGSAHVGRLLCLLIQHFPFSVKTDQGAGFVGPNEAAEMLRSQLFSMLYERADEHAVATFRQIEAVWGTVNPWLRSSRAEAERKFRLARWATIPPSAVAALLHDRSRRLIRSESDALDGVVEALRQFESRLRHHSPSDLPDLWNLPTGVPPSPRAEERVSEKLCQAIRSYFQAYAVTAEREVQIFRRNMSVNFGGIPGSEVDVLVRVPASGAASDGAIVVPVEVKLSNNPEARTGLRDQLVSRYMSQTGSTVGAFVVVWMHAAGLAATHRPIWPSLAGAVAELEQQARDVAGDQTRGSVRVAAIVIDASLA